MSDATAQVPRRSFWRYATLAALFVYALSVYVPWQPQFPGSELDSSWALMLHWARNRRLQFGSDLVFTYGPWGFLMAGYHLRTYPQMIAGWTLFTAVFFWALVRLGERFGARWWAMLWIAIIIALSGVTIHYVQDLRLYLLCCVFLLIHFYIDRRAQSPLKIALVMMMALASEMKFSIAFMAIAVLGIVSAEQILRRRVPWYVLLYVATLLVGWLVAGQSLSNLPAYILTSLQISRTYGQAETVYTSTEALDVLMFLLMAAGLHVVLGMAHWRDWRTVVLTQAGLAGMMFLLFKVGYVRHDGHELVAIHGIAIFALLIGAALWPRIPTRWPRGILVAVLVASFALACVRDALWESTNPARLMWQTVARFPSRLDFACSWITREPEAERQYQRDLSEFRNAHPIPESVRGPTDAYNWTQGVLLANNPEYRPRPVPQSYLAFSTALAKLNAQFLRSPRAAETILVEIQSIDDHLPSQEDALSWPELLTRYDAIDASQSLLVLRRASQPREYSLAPLAEVPAQMKQWVTVPGSDDPIWATIDVAPTAAGQILGTIYKTPHLVLKMQLANGDQGEFRLIREPAGAGFLLSPVINDRVDFALLNSRTWKKEVGDSIVSKFQLVAETPSGFSDCYEPSYHIRFFNLQYPRTDLSKVPGVSEFVSFRQFLHGARVVRSDFGVKVEYGANGEKILLVPGKTAIAFPVPSGATQLTVNFGVWNSEAMQSSFAAKDPATIGSAPAGFRVYAMVGDPKKPHPLMRWHRELDPAQNPRDRGGQSATIRFPDSAPAEVMLETDGAVPPSGHYPYWSGVSFK